MTLLNRREADRGIIARAFTIGSRGWDWFDKRQVFERGVALAILYGTIEIVSWAMTYAEVHSEKSGIDAAAIIAAVSAPYMALQAAAIAFMFRARQ